MNQTLKTIYIGYDPRQPIAYNVAAHSIASRLSKPIPITRLQLNQLPMTRRGLTEFTYSRFLVPYLSEFSGYSLFIDADMLVRDDLSAIVDAVDPTAAVSVVMHDAAFERPSLMVFNNKRCRVLSPEYIDDASHNLFTLSWASKVGALPSHWNHVVGYNQPNPMASVIHFTKGVPCWPETDGCEWASAWHEEHRLMNGTVTFQELMGTSVHVLKK